MAGVVPAPAPHVTRARGQHGRRRYLREPLLPQVAEESRETLAGKQSQRPRETTDGVASPLCSSVQLQMGSVQL